MTCKEIETLLPAWLEGQLPADQKECLETHLKTCASCSASAENLRATARLVGKLEEVEPPLWLKTRVMARVREEAERKESLFRKLFYPLHVKIPVQALATVLVAVVAWNVYKTGEPDIGRMVPSAATVGEIQKTEPKPEHPRESLSPLPDRKKTPALSSSEKKPAPTPSALSEREAPKQEEVGVSAGSAVGSVKSAEPEQIPPAKETGPIAGTGAKDPSVRARLQENDATDRALSLERKQKDMKPDVTGAAKMAKRAGTAAPAASAPATALPAKPPPVYDVTVRVRDLADAAKVEELLKAYGAQRVNRLVDPGQVVLTADIGSERIGDFRERLETLGNVRGRPSDTEVRDGVVPVRVRIIRE